MLYDFYIFFFFSINLYIYIFFFNGFVLFYWYVKFNIKPRRTETSTDAWRNVCTSNSWGRVEESPGKSKNSSFNRETRAQLRPDIEDRTDNEKNAYYYGHNFRTGGVKQRNENENNNHY